MRLQQWGDHMKGPHPVDRRPTELLNAQLAQYSRVLESSSTMLDLPRIIGQSRVSIGALLPISPRAPPMNSKGPHGPLGAADPNSKANGFLSGAWSIFSHHSLLTHDLKFPRGDSQESSLAGASTLGQCGEIRPLSSPLPSWWMTHVSA